MAAIVPIRPISRNAGIQVPGLISSAQWIDILALTANTAQSYTLPTDSAGAKGRILGISATTGPCYINFAGTAVVASTGVTNGTGSAIVRTDLGSVLIAVPDGATTMSIICG